jgi:hypothetical protein
MELAKIWHVLPVLGLMLSVAGRAGRALLEVEWTGSISSLAATQVANCLLWHGLETMPQQGRANRRPGRRVRAPTEQAQAGGPSRAGTPHPSLPRKGGGIHIPSLLWVRMNVWGRRVQTPEGESLGTELTLSSDGIPACRAPPQELRRPAETPALLPMPL